jgi:hypothetical protein
VCNKAFSRLARNPTARFDIDKLTIRCPLAVAAADAAAGGAAAEASGKKRKLGGAPAASCPWTGALGTLSQHETTCVLQLVPCTLPGCAVSARRGELEAHKAACAYRLQPCAHCAAQFTAATMQAHLLQCPAALTVRLQAAARRETALVAQLLRVLQNSKAVGTDVVPVMRLLAGDAAAQAQCCQALTVLEPGEANRALVAGIVTVVVQALTAHAADANVQKFGCFALANLFCAFTRADRNTAGTVATVAAVMAALAAHPQHSGVQLEGFRALQNMTHKSALVAGVVANAGGIDAAVNALTNGALGKDVQLMACEALSNLTQSVSANKDKAGNAAGIAAVMGLLGAAAAGPSRVVLIQRAGFEVLANVCQPDGQRVANDTTRVTIIKAVVTGLSVKDAGHDATAFVEMQHFGCAVLQSLTLQRAGQQAAAAAGAMRVLIAALNTKREKMSNELKKTSKQLNSCAAAALARVLREASPSQLAQARALGAEAALEKAALGTQEVTEAIAILKQQKKDDEEDGGGGSGAAGGGGVAAVAAVAASGVSSGGGGERKGALQIKRE